MFFNPTLQENAPKTLKELFWLVGKAVLFASITLLLTDGMLSFTLPFFCNPAVPSSIYEMPKLNGSAEQWEDNGPMTLAMCVLVGVIAQGFVEIFARDEGNPDDNTHAPTFPNVSCEKKHPDITILASEAQGSRAVGAASAQAPSHLVLEKGKGVDSAQHPSYYTALQATDQPDITILASEAQGLRAVGAASAQAPSHVVLEKGKGVASAQHPSYHAKLQKTDQRGPPAIVLPISPHSSAMIKSEPPTDLDKKSEARLVTNLPFSSVFKSGLSLLDIQPYTDEEVQAKDQKARLMASMSNLGEEAEARRTVGPISSQSFQDETHLLKQQSQSDEEPIDVDQRARNVGYVSDSDREATAGSNTGSAASESNPDRPFVSDLPSNAEEEVNDMGFDSVSMRNACTHGSEKTEEGVYFSDKEHLFTSKQTSERLQSSGQNGQPSLAASQIKDGLMILEHCKELPKTPNGAEKRLSTPKRYNEVSGTLRHNTKPVSLPEPFDRSNTIIALNNIEAEDYKNRLINDITSWRFAPRPKTLRDRLEFLYDPPSNDSIESEREKLEVYRVREKEFGRISFHIYVVPYLHEFNLLKAWVYLNQGVLSGELWPPGYVPRYVDNEGRLPEYLGNAYIADETPSVVSATTVG